MKAIFVLLVLFIAGGLAMYHWGGFSTFDPSQQGRDARAAVGRGMTWTKVIDAAGEPREYRVITEKKEKSGGVERSIKKPGGANKFKRDRLADRLANNSLPHGFVFEYQFSQSEAFSVTFDGSGSVISIDDMVTMADLLDMK
ncbi:MAG: hypothetical protein GY842_26585 [bacterium]|nr:hypothetical protein [bacterium]